MNADERDELELGDRVFFFAWNENRGTDTQRVETITRRFLAASDRRRGPSHRRPKLIRAATFLGGLTLAIGLSDCTIPANLVQIVDDGAVQHAQTHVAEGNGDEKVLCAAVSGPGTAEGWLVPSTYVATLGCNGALAAATSTECHTTGLNPVAPFYPDLMCSVLALGVSPGPVLT